MKNSHPGQGGGCDSEARTSDTQKSSPCIPPSFRIVRIERCDFEKKQATGTIEVEALGLIDFELFVFDDGRRPFVAGRSIRSKYNGTYERTTQFVPEFADELLAAVEARLAADTDVAD